MLHICDQSAASHELLDPYHCDTLSAICLRKGRPVNGVQWISLADPTAPEWLIARHSMPD